MHKLKNPQLLRQQCYINGEWISAENNKTFVVNNPYNQEIIGYVPDCGNTETQYAIESAHKALLVWQALTAKQRADLLLAWSALIRENRQDLATILTLEQGKPWSESLAEIDYGNAFIEWYAAEGRRIYGDVIPSNKKEQRVIVLKQAIGVVAAITPWNFPNAMIARKCAPALAAGCSIVIKPAEETPFSALALAVLAEQAGIPPGVINVLTGNAEVIGAVLTSHTLVRKLSFTGSTAVGKLLMQQCASTVKKISLELGGNAPFIVFDDADIDAAVIGAINSKFRNTGQTCVCANRIYVQQAIYQTFSEKFLEQVKKLKLGNGLDDQVEQGPLINQSALAKVQHLVADAEQRGAKILLGGKLHETGGLFFSPTVLANVDESMLITNEETFGPVAPLLCFQTEDEVIARANATPYGLAAYFYSRDIHRVWRVAEALEYGMVGINAGIISTEVAPFGGIKESGIGREGSKYGIEEYLELKYLCMA
jgi:succinate-semialdehyde dehydrogenase / glutarate-semialdehyde dehydrogenase